ncbi:OmpA family protein [Flavobacterium sp. RHBU_24]|uniref:OmpA family protein n=1 Tax=Flavobacterium sp. RHBU_24 TaxID=3391185 RepID=UPI003984CA7C
MKKYSLLLLLSYISMTAQQQKTAFAYFDFDSDVLTEDAHITLDSISSELKGTDSYAIKIYGFTDDAGTESYNRILAQKRADRVAGYFQLHGFLIAEAAVDSPGLRAAVLTAEKKRRVRIEYTARAQPYEVANTNAGYGSSVSIPEIRGRQGTNVILSGGIGPGEVAVSEFFSTESMIANGMYGIAEGGDILKSEGMITVCNTYKQVDSTGMYTIQIPANRGVINDKASVWLSLEDKEGKLVWQNTSIEVTTDSITKMYTIKLPAKPAECTHINLDMFANRENGYRVVYLYTDKPYDFVKARMYNSYGDMYFSAKVNDTTWAFCVPNHTGLAGILFTGAEKDSRKEIGLQLRKCRHKVDKKRNHHYYITERALIAGLPKQAEKKKKKSWFSELF